MMKTHKTLLAVVNFIIVMLFALDFVLMAGYVLTVTSSDVNGVSHLGGTSLYPVELSYVDEVADGDMIIFSQADDTPTVEGIILFKTDDITTDGVTRIVVGKVSAVNGEGEYVYYTVLCSGVSVYVAPGDIIGVYYGQKIALIGGLITLLKNPLGFMLLIAIPIGAFIIYQLIRLIRQIMAYNSNKLNAADDTDELLDEYGISDNQRENIVDEYFKISDNEVPQGDRQNKKDKL